MSNTAPANTEMPFKLAVPDAEIDLLRKKLELVRFPDELDGAGWDYGAPLADIKRLTAHWKSAFDWRKAEVEINKLPMFTRDIEVDGFGTLNVHYVHQVSEVNGAIPLLFVHGCKWQFQCNARVQEIAHSRDSRRRAGALSGSEEDASAFDRGREGPTQFPRRRTKPSWNWFLRSTTQDGVQGTSVR